MRLSYSRYTAFLTNPEKFRLYYMLGLVPENDDAPTRMNLGRRRGSCFHDMQEHRAPDGTIDAAEYLRIVKTYGIDLVKRCAEMATVIPDLGPLFLVEAEFEVPILDGKHSINGRIDHGFTVDGVPRIGDFKTTKGTRTKAELQKYFDTLETSSQSHFYLAASRAMGRPIDLFTYHVIMAPKDKTSNPRYIPLDLSAQDTCPSAVARTMAGVYAACEAIEFLTNEYGIEKPWPHSNNWPCCGDKFFCGYQGLCGRTLPKGVVPPGFTNKYAELIQLESESE